MGAGPFLDSARVEIDGEVVGVLQRFRLGGQDGPLATFMADVDDGFPCRVLLR